MKSILTFFLLNISVLLSGQQVFHDKDAQIRNVGDFHSVEVSHAMELRLSTGNENVVAISAPPDFLENVITEVKNGKLRVTYTDRKWFRGGQRIRVYVSAKTLKNVTASGACDVITSGELKTESLKIELSGASDFKGAVNVNSLAVELSGASDATLRGQAGNVNIQASGASHFKGYELTTDNCLAESSGASDIKIKVNKVINANASGASAIHYEGDAQPGQIKTSGASNISRKG